MSKEHTIGIDIGVASVGWAILNETKNILESGVCIFPEADATKNAIRRAMRQGRRLKRREHTRIADFEKLWNLFFSEHTESKSDVLLLRNKGINERLSLDEIYNVLRYMLKHRGIFYLEDSIEDGTGSDYARGISINQKELEDKLPCQIQAERIEKYGVFRGNNTVTIDDENVTLSNVFTVSSYKKELEVFLKKQAEFYPIISEEFISKYMYIWGRKRKYYEGPGNELSRSKYGRYTINLNEKGEYITEDNIFEKLIGKCSVYPEEFRAAAASYTAQEFNALEDLNNLIVNGRKLTIDEKMSIIAAYKSDTAVNVRKIIKKVIGENITTFTGFRIDKNEKEIFHTMEIYRSLKKFLGEYNYSIDSFSREDLDEIARILTINTEMEGINEAIEKSSLIFDSYLIELLISFRKKNGSYFSKWHSFSLKIMNELIPEMYEQPKNQQQLLSDIGFFKKKNEALKSYNSIPTDIITEEIYNPVVKRSVSITVKVINALIEKYGNPGKIVIEMPRDKNSDEEKKRIKDNQKKNENELSEIIKTIRNGYGIDITDDTFRHHKGLVLKLKLWNEQRGKCLYSGKPIPINELIENQNLFEVDHIIPISISFDDSRANKALVYATENQDKGNRTPYMYLSTVNREWNFEKYTEEVKSLSLNKNKLKNLLFMEDIRKVDVVKGFINRNITDTSYASRTVLNLLQGYFSVKECDTKVSVVRGAFTHQMRQNLRIEKDRDESYNHHAVDAILIALSKLGYDEYRARQNAIIDFETGEILSEKDWKNQDELYLELLYQKEWYEIKQKIAVAEKNIRYWHKVDRKCNRALCNQTIYGTRQFEGETYTIDFLDLYNDSDVVRFKKMIDGGKENSFLMYENDPKTFEQLMLVYNAYKSEKNPFVAYHKETGDYVRKYTKKDHNGNIIRKIKFRKEKTGSCIDISHKYGFEKGSKKVILDTLVPYRMDVYKNVNDGLYYFVGVKQSDIKCLGNQFVIDEEAYAKILVNEKMILDGQKRDVLESRGYQFYLSFYRNNIIEYEKNGEIIKERFCSRTMPQKKNYIETKPISANKYMKQNPVGLAKTSFVSKIITDILGNEKVINKEKFQIIVDSF